MEKKDLNDEKLLYNVRETAAVLGGNVNMVYELIYLYLNWGVSRFVKRY